MRLRIGEMTELRAYDLADAVLQYNNVVDQDDGNGVARGLVYEGESLVAILRPHRPMILISQQQSELLAAARALFEDLSEGERDALMYQLQAMREQVSR